MKTGAADLTPQEQIPTLQVDKVYTAQRVEYNNGSFVGLTEDGRPAKPVLAFMIQSVAGKYKDVVCLMPVNKLNTPLLCHWFDCVMDDINDLFLVVAISVDNHVCNR